MSKAMPRVPLRTDPAPESQEFVVYLSGPMRGIPHYNFPEFDRVARILRSKGYTVLNPAEEDRTVNIHEFTPAEALTNSVMRQCFRRDCEAVCKADAVVLLDGWEKSKGVGAELHLASVLGLDTFEFVTDTPNDGHLRMVFVSFTKEVRRVE